MSSAKIKIGIMTILKVNNYGAELQAFALPKVLNDLGYEAENIDYLYYKHRDYIPVSQSKPMVKISLKDKVKRHMLILMEITSSLMHTKSVNTKQSKFDEFHRKYTFLSEKTYRSMDELYSDELKYDLFIVGSDQVWNPATLSSLKPYFLTFAPSDKKKISYASSFGVYDINEESRAVYKECINNLDHISTRENQGVDIVKRLTGRTAIQVVDPTLLIPKNEWEEMAVFPAEKEPYILLYILTHSPYIVKLAQQISKITGYQVIRVSRDPGFFNCDLKIKNIIDAGPEEFLGWFSKASFVLTNSFHGTSFSVMFQKPFFTIAPKTKSNNSRQQSFLELLELDSRLIKEGAPFPGIDQLKIDYEEGNSILKKERKRSLDFLRSSITD